MKKTLFIVLALLPLSLFAENLLLNHFQPAKISSDRPTPITLNISGDYQTIDQAALFYRETGQSAYVEKTLYRSDISSSEINFTLPSLANRQVGYEYYFQLRRVDGSTISLPTSNPQNNPFRVFHETSEPYSDRFILLTTEQKVAKNTDLVFAVSLFGLETDIETDKVRLFLNDRDISERAAISLPLIVYTHSQPQQGSYSFRMEATLRDGTTIKSPTWDFEVMREPLWELSLPFDTRGSAVFSSNIRSISESDTTQTVSRDNNDASFRMNLYGRQNWFSYRTRLYLSSHESSGRQSVNRFSIGFSVPNFDLNLIDSTPNYGSFLLTNKNIRGFSTRLHSGSLSIRAAYGETVRAIDGKETTQIIDDEPVDGYSGGTFQRNVLAGKIELGEGDGLSLGFGFAKSKDSMSSLDERFYLREQITESDTTMTPISTPKDNFVLGGDAKLSFLNQRVVVGAEVAASIYNSNIIDGVMTKDELEEYTSETIPFDPETFESLIIINTNIEPLIPSKANVAYQVYFRFFLYNNLLNFSYSEVGASFRSLSAGYIQNDSRILSLSDYVTLFNNQLSIDAGFHLLQDNLSGQKSKTTTNATWYLSTLYRPRNLPYFRVGYNTTSASDDLDEKQQDQDFVTTSFGIGYQFDQLEFVVTNIDISYNLSQDTDLTDNPAFDSNRNSIQFDLNNAWKEFPLTTRLNFSHTGIKDDSDPQQNLSRSFNLIGLKNEYAFFDGNLIPYLDLRFNTFGGDQHSQTLNTYELGTMIRPLERTTIKTRIDFNNYTNKDLADKDYRDFGWYLSITQRF
jgi:hypothetical protein